jgi:hypothetical protein
MRSQVVIENPVLNSASAAPTRHFRFDEDGITEQIEEIRRPSAYFVPVPQPRKRGKQMVLDTQWTQDRVEENRLVNQICEKVATASNLWVPAVNNDGRFGRWAFTEVTDPWDAKNTIRSAIDRRTCADTILKR